MCDERSERKVEEPFLYSLVGMLLSLRSKMPSLCRKAVSCFCCLFAPAVVPPHLSRYNSVVADHLVNPGNVTLLEERLLAGLHDAEPNPKKDLAPLVEEAVPNPGS